MKFSKETPKACEGWYWAIDTSLSSRWDKNPFPVECMVQRGIMRVFEGREELTPQEVSCLAFGDPIEEPEIEEESYGFGDVRFTLAPAKG